MQFLHIKAIVVTPEKSNLEKSNSFILSNSKNIISQEFRVSSNTNVTLFSSCSSWQNVLQDSLYIPFTKT